MARTDYTATVVSSYLPLTKRETVKAKDMSATISLNDAVAKDTPLVLSPANLIIVDIHNEHGENKDYRKAIIIDKGGNWYSTGSESLYTSLQEIMEDMGDEEYEVEIKRFPSKNYSGEFLKACLV